jgi:hypothetical protein
MDIANPQERKILISISCIRHPWDLDTRMMTMEQDLPVEEEAVLPKIRDGEVTNVEELSFWMECCNR